LKHRLFVGHVSSILSIGDWHTLELDVESVMTLLTAVSEVKAQIDVYHL
jgi:hypothetical protein